MLTKNSMLKLSRLFARPMAALLLLAGMARAAEPLEFHRAVELALKHSGTMMAATADRSRAAQRYRAERFAYAPTVVFGSGLGDSVGVPVTIAGQVPSVFNFTHNQTIFNLATQQNIKAAHSDSVAATMEYTDRADQVILDTALLYIELESTGQRLALAREQKRYVDETVFVSQQRQQEGMGNLLQAKRAELDAARVELRIADLESSIDLLREQLARSTGLPAATVEIVGASIPAAPPVRSEDDLASVALANSIAVRVADEHVRAAHDRARAEHRMRYPSIDFAGQFAEYAPYIDYHMTRSTTHNYSFGLNFKVPILDLAQNARAAAADAAALHTEAEAQSVRDKVASDAIRAQHLLHQTQIQLKVNRLETEVAEANVDAIALQMLNGKATLADREAAHAAIADRKLLLLQTQFDLLRAQLQLLRQTGELRSWALGEK